MKNLVYMGTFNGFYLYTRYYGKKLFCYLVPTRFCDSSLDKYDLSLYRVSSTLALEIMNTLKHFDK